MKRSDFLRKAVGAVFSLSARLPLVLPEVEAVEAEAEAVAVSGEWSAWSSWYPTTFSTSTGVQFYLADGEGYWMAP